MFCRSVSIPLLLDFQKEIQYEQMICVLSKTTEYFPINRVLYNGHRNIYQRNLLGDFTESSLDTGIFITEIG
jgi:hypothetical protein